MNVDLSEEQVDLIVESVLQSIRETNDMEKVLELENIVWALGKGDEL